MKIYWTTNQIPGVEQLPPSERRERLREIKWRLFSTWRGWLGPLMGGIGAGLGYVIGVLFFGSGLASIIGAAIGGAMGGFVCSQIICRQVERELQHQAPSRSS